MKKILSIILVCLTVFGLVGCGSSVKEHSLVYKECRQEQLPFNDEKLNCVTVYTEYTNNSNESAMPADYVEVKAYQNGVALSPWVFTGQETNGYFQCDTSIQSGATANIIWIFELRDESTVTVELPDGSKQELSW